MSLFHMLGKSAVQDVPGGGGVARKIFDSANLANTKYSGLKTIVDFLNEAIIPFTIVFAALCAMTLIFCMIAMAKAEDASTAQSLKGRFIGIIVTLLVIIAVVWIGGFIISNLPSILDGIRGTLGGVVGETGA